MGARSSRDERIRGVDRLPPRGECGLIAARSLRRLTRRIEKAEPSEKTGGRFPLRGTHASDQLGDRHTRRREVVPAREDAQQCPAHALVPAQMRHEDGRVEQERGQVRSERRTFRTQAFVARRSRHCG